jgi:hypothetical protein
MMESITAIMEVYEAKMMVRIDVCQAKMLAAIRSSIGEMDVTNSETNNHQDVSKEHAAVETGKAPKKRHRDRHLAAGRSGKPKELTGGNCGSRKLAAACRMTRRAGVAWRKRNVVRKDLPTSPERTKEQEETKEGPGMQNWNE